MVKTYDQFCGLAHALDLIGSRWTLLIIRELMVEPRRFSEIEEGLPGIPSNVLSSRLKELEASGLAERQVMPRPSSGVAYALTPYGRELEPILSSLGMWGAKSMGPPTEGVQVSCSSLALGLRSMFEPGKHDGPDFSFEVKFSEQEQTLRGSVGTDALTIPDNSVEVPDFTIRADPLVISSIFQNKNLLAGSLNSGDLELEGSRKFAETFFEIFQIPN